MTTTTTESRSVKPEIRRSDHDDLSIHLHCEHQATHYNGVTRTGINDRGGDKADRVPCRQVTELSSTTMNHL